MLIEKALLKKSFYYIREHGIYSFFLIVKSKLNIFKNFSSWIEKNEPTTGELDRQRLDKFAYEPLISIIVPVFNTSEKHLTSMIESVLNQTYSKWELCIADGGSRNSLRSLLSSYASDNGRIKVKFLSENEGIAGNSNSALSLATGEFIILLDHDDELAPFALYEVVNALNQDDQLDFIYSDRDKISENGKRMDPSFRPDWAPDYFLSCNYLSHLVCIRKKIIDKVGGFRQGYEGSQDYDLFLRVVECTNKIAHIPKILYHWRMTAQSVSCSPDSKPYAYEAGKKALADAMKRRGVSATVLDGAFKGTYRIKYRINEPKKLAIIIPSKDNVKVLKRCVNSIVDKTSYGNFEVLIVDNQSTEDETFRYYDKLKSHENIRVIKYDQPFNYSAINNYAVQQCDSDILLFLNNDTEVITHDWVEAMMEFAQRMDVGAVGAKLLYPDNTIQHGGVILGIGWGAGHSHKHSRKEAFGYGFRLVTVQNFSAVTAACMMVRREVFEEVGGFEERYSHAVNDIDFCLKIREKGYLVVFTPYAELYHYESASRGYEDTPKKKARFAKEIELFETRWSSLVSKGDPYYNKNLSLHKADFSFRR